MKKILILITFLLMTYSGAISCNIPIKLEPQKEKSGNVISIIADSGKTFSSTVKVYINNNQIQTVQSASKYVIRVVIPSNLSAGIYKVRVDDILREDCGEALVEVLNSNTHANDSTTGHDPDPKSQNGEPKESGKDPNGKLPGREVHNPPGGWNNDPYVTCDSLHKIDGQFTDSVFADRKEWDGVVPLHGRYSNLYIDYCDDRHIMYLLNDWFWGTGKYDSSTCYNRFTLFTGGGSEQWDIWVYHSIKRGIKVLRNGIDVSKDSNYVLGGSYGFHSSLLEDSAHTIYEFGLKVQSGIFYLPAQCDPYQPPSGGTSVVTICDEKTDYGLVQDPAIYSGKFDKDGTTLREHERYIPLSGVAGLVNDTAVFRGNFKNKGCNGPHKIDGLFTKFEDNTIEWSNSEPAKGKYSNLYADFCDSTLYILNDWKLGTREPDEKNCYNLFELFTGGAKEHWGIYVYHDINKGIRVFRNGIEVSGDTNIVKGGAYNFHTSLLEKDTDHTIYEFAIKAMEGDWLLYLCDPGPSSFCDGNPEPAPRQFDGEIKGKKIEKSGNHSLGEVINAAYNDVVTIGFGTKQNTSDWFGRRFKATIDYDYNLFYPIISDTSSLLSEQKVKWDSFSFTIPKPGTLIMEGVADKNFSADGVLFSINGIVLAGQDSVSNLTGYVDIGNRNTYLRRTSITPIKISATSDCPVTNNLVRLVNPSIKTIMVSPNPVNKDHESIDLTVMLNRDDNIAFQIFDMLGNKIQETQPQTGKMGVNSFTLKNKVAISGVYLIHAFNGSSSLFTPIIVE